MHGEICKEIQMIAHLNDKQSFQEIELLKDLGTWKPLINSKQNVVFVARIPVTEMVLGNPNTCWPEEVVVLYYNKYCVCAMLWVSDHRQRNSFSTTKQIAPNSKVPALIFCYLYCVFGQLTLKHTKKVHSCQSKLVTGVYVFYAARFHSTTSNSEKNTIYFQTCSAGLLGSLQALTRAHSSWLKTRGVCSTPRCSLLS